MDRPRARRDRLRRLVRKLGAEALLVTDFINVTYLTGFTGDDSYLLIFRDGEILLSDPRYTTQLQEECPDVELAIRTAEETLTEAVTKVVLRAKVTRLAQPTQFICRGRVLCQRIVM